MAQASLDVSDVRFQLGREAGAPSRRSRRRTASVSFCRTRTTEASMLRALAILRRSSLSGSGWRPGARAGLMGCGVCWRGARPRQARA
jgi:hypothetical protein